MGIEAIYQKPNTSKKHPENKIYPYLLRGLTIDRVNQVWCTDITYIRMPKGFLYLVVVMDWVSRKALSWRLSFQGQFADLRVQNCCRCHTSMLCSRYRQPLLKSPSRTKRWFTISCSEPRRRR